MEKALLVKQGDSIEFALSNFNNESELQELIKANPSIINISSIFDSDLLIIGKETWRIDVLAMTSSCVPVIIETKKRNNPDMRDLIAQIFEYASLLQKKTYSDLEEVTSSYFSIKCNEEKYKNKKLSNCLKIFLDEANDSDLMDEDNFKQRIEENLQNGEFYLVIIVDELDSTTRRSIDFFNSKLNKLKIEIIEIKKFKANNNTLYVPSHANPENKKAAEKNAPGKMSYDEMLLKATNHHRSIVQNIFDTWTTLEGCDYKMGTEGLSLKYRGYSILYLFIDRMEVAKYLKKQLNKNGEDIDLADILKNKIKEKFNENRILLDKNDVDTEDIIKFIENIYTTTKENVFKSYRN